MLAINKIAKPGERNFTIKSLGRGYCGHRPSPANQDRRPPLIARRKITKVRLWLREFLFCTRRKISCCVFHLFWEKMHAISYSLFHWSEREKFQLRFLFPLIPLLICTCPAGRTRAGSQGARIPQNHEKSGFWILKGTAKGRQRDGKETARHRKNGAFQGKENAPFQGKEMQTMSVEVLSLPSRRRRPGSTLCSRLIKV